MTDKPKLSQALADAFNNWLDEFNLLGEIREMVYQVIVTGDYANQGRPKYLRLAVNAFEDSHRYSTAKAQQQEISFYTDVKAGEPPHPGLVITAIEKAHFTADPLTVSEQAKYRDVAILNGLIQKLIVNLNEDQQTKALALAVYFTAAVRWCVTEGYQMIDGQQDTDKNAPALRLWFHQPNRIYTTLHLDYTPLKAEQLNFQSLSSLKNPKP
jgi:hypothetical protein